MMRLRFPLWVVLAIGLSGAACQRAGADRVTLAVAGSVQTMGAALDIAKVKACPGPASWNVSAWLRHDELVAHGGWILTCPLAPGDPIARACLRRPLEESGSTRVMALEGAERIWPAQHLRLFACGIQDAPICRDSGRAAVLARLAELDEAGRVQLRLGLSPEQRAAIEARPSSRFFVASLANSGAEDLADAPIATVADLLDGKRLLRLHTERMARMRETMEAWGRVTGDTEMSEP